MSSSPPDPGAQAPQMPRPQPLSRSSSSLLGEGQGQRQELRKSASSTVWRGQSGKAGASSQTPEEEACQAESMEQTQSSSPRPPSSGRGHWRSSTVGNVSTMGSGDLARLRTPSAAAIQRSHSDLVRSIQARGHGGTARTASLSCSALGSSPVHAAQLPSDVAPGSGGEVPLGLERNLADEVGISNSVGVLGESQAQVLPLDLGDKASPCSSDQAEPKVTGQPVAASSCHALPPAALLCSVREAGVGSCCHALPATGLLAFPKLVASVSESGLQVQHHGVRFHCRLPAGLPCCAHPWGTPGLTTEPGSRTKDVWTMTSTSDLAPAPMSLPPPPPPLPAQDAGVQVAPVAACKAVATSPSLEAPGALHMFPEVTVGSSSLEEAPSPVRDVRWDAEGMTWEVYGAAVDPEVLGVAIQRHLEMQFEQLQRAPASEDSLSAEGRRGPLRAVMQSLRRPSCCGCSGAAPE